MGLIDTLWPVIIVHSALGIPICALMMRNFFATVPNALREAAIMEGASEWQVLTQVVLPLSLPALAVLATLQFTWIWNDFLWPLIFTQSDDKRTIMIGIVNLQGPVFRRLGRAGRAVAGGQPAHAACLPVLPALLHQGHDHGRGKGITHGTASAFPTFANPSARCR